MKKSKCECLLCKIEEKEKGLLGEIDGFKRYLKYVAESIYNSDEHYGETDEL